MTLLQQMLQFITDPQNAFADQTVVTIEYSVIAILLSVVIAIPLGALVAQHPLAATLSANVTGLARAIPTFAFLAFVLPFLGIGFTPVVVALTLLGIPPILLNTIAGLRGVDAAATEAGRGMGMTPWQARLRVQIPLALPIIAAGARISAVQIVATVPIAGLIGGGGYGDYILEGINLLQRVPLFVGASGIVVLALAAEIGLSAVQRAVTPLGLRVRAGLEAGGTQGAGLEEPGGESAAA